MFFQEENASWEKPPNFIEGIFKKGEIMTKNMRLWKRLLKFDIIIDSKTTDSESFSNTPKTFVWWKNLKSFFFEFWKKVFQNKAWMKNCSLLDNKRNNALWGIFYMGKNLLETMVSRNSISMFFIHIGKWHNEEFLRLGRVFE